MHLFNREDFGQRYGIDLSVSDFKDAVQEASRASTQTCASRFRHGGFELRYGRRDYFHVSRTFGGSSHQTEFRLSRGNVDANTGFSAYAAPGILTLRNGDYTSSIDLEDVALDGQSNRMWLDNERGFITVNGVNLMNYWVAIEYDSGFPVNNQQEYIGVPEWLEEAAMLQAIIILKQGNVFKSDAEEDLSTVKDTLSHLFSEHVRYNPTAYKPKSVEAGTQG